MPRNIAVQDDALARKVQALCRPDCYPERSGTVEPIETHMSWVFLTDCHASKLKKPIRTSYLDFTSFPRGSATARRESA